MVLGIVVGLEAEAAIARRIGPSHAVAISGATAFGAHRAARLLAGNGATHLLSFGLAGGLAPGLEAGTVLMPATVMVDGRRLRCDPALRNRLGPGDTGPLLHTNGLVATAGNKARLHRDTGCVALDMESGAVALAAEASGLGFAVLRVVCDPAERDLPPAARLPLRPDGRLRGGAIAASILSRPGQIGALMALGRDAKRARDALLERATDLAKMLTTV